jgi:hypothetical protein
MPIGPTAWVLMLDRRCVDHNLRWYTFLTLHLERNENLGGLSQRLLRLFDLRSSTPAVGHAQGRVYALASDSFELHYLAAAGDGVVTIWDVKRKKGQHATTGWRAARDDKTRFAEALERADKAASVQRCSSYNTI